MGVTLRQTDLVGFLSEIAELETDEASHLRLAACGLGDVACAQLLALRVSSRSRARIGTSATEG